MRLMGLSDAAIKKELEQDQPPTVEVWPEHLDAWSLFLKVQTRWEFQPFGSKPVSLSADWVQLYSKLMFPRKRRLEIINQLQLIEAGALQAWPKN